MKYFLLFALPLFAAQVQAPIRAQKHPKPAYFQGTLLEIPSENVSPGWINIQPYFFFTESYGSYDSHWNCKKSPKSWQLQQQIYVEPGITDWLDITFFTQGIYNQELGSHDYTLGDSAAYLGFQLARDTIGGPPNIRIQLFEFFPTGKHDDLDPSKNGTDVGGTGAYQTGIFFAVEKYFVSGNFQMTANVSLGYTYGYKGNVHGVNAYGGDATTRGKVKTANTTFANLGLQFALTQRWIIGTDINYVHYSKAIFSGATTAPVGSPASSLISVAPVIEYGFTPNIGILLASWWSLAGRNTDAFGNLTFSINATF